MKGTPNPPRVSKWLTEPLAPEVRRAIDRLARAPDVQRIAVMPDVHLAEGVCIGTVVATRSLLYPQAVGGDIGCGISAAAFDIEAAALIDDAVALRLLARIQRRVPILKHATPPPWPPELAYEALSAAPLQSLARRHGRIELGTLGRGNHFLEFQSDEDGRLWLMVHSGSRGVGQAVSEYHLRRGQSAAGRLVYLEAESDAGRRFLEDANWARRYAAANRRAIAEAAIQSVGDMLEGAWLPESYFDCSHNDVRREEHFGELLWVHRKGATPASADEPGIIPGSMGTLSVHVVGRGCAEALRSSSHGAGRALSRREARRAIGVQEFRKEMRGVRFDETLADGLREESPSTYKDLLAVLRAQRDLVKIARRLTPILVHKGT